MAKCDCSLKHQNGGICTCQLDYEDLFGSKPETSDEDEFDELEEEPKKDSTRITRDTDDFLH